MVLSESRPDPQHVLIIRTPTQMLALYSNAFFASYPAYPLWAASEAEPEQITSSSATGSTDPGSSELDARNVHQLRGWWVVLRDAPLCGTFTS